MSNIPKKKHHFAIRTDRVLLDKLAYIAEYNGRSANKEVEQLIFKHIKDFEELHGEIKIDTD